MKNMFHFQEVTVGNILGCLIVFTAFLLSFHSNRVFHFHCNCNFHFI